MSALHSVGSSPAATSNNGKFAIRWLWTCATTVIGLWIVLYYTIPVFQVWLDKLLGVSFYNPAVALFAAILWFAFGDNKVTSWLAQVENSVVHSAVLGLGLLIVAVIRFWPVVVQLWNYVWKFTDPSVGGLCIGAIVLLVIAGLIFWARK